MCLILDEQNEPINTCYRICQTTGLHILVYSIPPNPQRYSSLIGFAIEKKKAKSNHKLESKEQIELQSDLISDYSLFVNAIRSPLTREYYLRRLRRFFDFLELKGGRTLEERCNIAGHSQISFDTYIQIAFQILGRGTEEIA